MPSPVYNDANFRAQFPAFASVTAYPVGALQFAWNMGGNWVNQSQSSLSPSSPVTDELFGIGNGANTFAHVMNYVPVVPGTVVIAAGAIVATDNGQGTLIGAGITAGTINYASGVASITYTTAPVNGLQITTAYSYVEPSPWSAPWYTGFGMTAAQLQQAADLMGAVIAYQLYGPVNSTSSGQQSYSQAGEAPGAVQSATEGSISATFQLPEIGSSAFKSMLLASPPYGRMLLALLQVSASVGPYIPSCRPAWIPP